MAEWRDIRDGGRSTVSTAMLLTAPGTLALTERPRAISSARSAGVVLRRHHLTDPWHIRLAARWCPVQLVLFDLLYDHGRSVLAELLGLATDLFGLQEQVDEHRNLGSQDGRDHGFSPGNPPLQ